MNSEDRGGFLELINATSEYYSKPALQQNILEIYFNGLSPYSFDQVRGAISKHMGNTESGQFMPKIADIKKYIEGGEITHDGILSAARMRSSPMGILCLIRIGTYDLEHQKDMFYLKQRAQECIDLMPEWRKRAVTGDYTDHEVRTMLKHSVNPERPFYCGLEAPANQIGLKARAKQIWIDEFADREEEPKQLTSEECKTVTPAGERVIAEIMKRLDN